MRHYASYPFFWNRKEILRPLGLVDTAADFHVKTPWRGPAASEDTEEPPVKVYEDVPRLSTKLLGRKSIASKLLERARRELGLPKRGL